MSQLLVVIFELNFIRPSFLYVRDGFAHSPLVERRTSAPHSLATELSINPIAPKIVKTAVSGLAASKKSPVSNAPLPAKSFAISRASVVRVISNFPTHCEKLVDLHDLNAPIFLGGGRLGR
jgi:hypothetical protein